MTLYWLAFFVLGCKDLSHKVCIGVCHTGRFNVARRSAVSLLVVLHSRQGPWDAIANERASFDGSHLLRGVLAAGAAWAPAEKSSSTEAIPFYGH